jgi:hypothetical protein
MYGSAYFDAPGTKRACVCVRACARAYLFHVLSSEFINELRTCNLKSGSWEVYDVMTLVCGESSRKNTILYVVVLSGVMIIVLVISPKFRKFKPGRERWIFKGDKNSYHNFLRMRSNAVGLMS